MNDKLTISTAQLLALFPDEPAARHYIESRRWPNGVRCPVCDSDRIGTHSPGLYRCNVCQEAFSGRTGTIFERSHVGLHHWLRALQLIAAGNGLTSTWLARETGLRQPTCWAILKRIEPSIKWFAGVRREPCNLDALINRVLAYRPKPHTVKAMKRARQQRKIQRKAST